MRKSHILLAAALSFAPLTAHATSVAYLTDEELFTKADIVVQARVHRFAEQYDLTEYEVEALECFKGCQKGQFLMMMSPGVSSKRPVSGTHEQIDGAPHPEVGDTIIVHLARMPNMPSLRVVALGLGMFTLKYDNALRKFMAHREVESLFLLRPTDLPARHPDNQVLVPSISFAGEEIAKLRARAGRR